MPEEQRARKTNVVQMNDTGARVNNKNYHTFTFSTDHVTVLTTIDSKSKMSAMYSYTGGQRLFYVIGDNFFNYLGKSKDKDFLLQYKRKAPYSEDEFEQVLLPLKKEKNFHRLYRVRVCAIQAWIATHPANIPRAILVSDDVGNFKFMSQYHQLCWVHELRHYRKLEALMDQHKTIKEQVLSILYDFYNKLKLFKANSLAAKEVERDFDKVVAIRTGYEQLDELLQNTKKRKAGLLKVLKYPFVPLHNNMSEQDLRENVIKRKVSGGTRTERGTYSWDVGLSLVHTCRKLKISFYHYIKDRCSKTYQIPALNHIVEQMP